MWAEPDPELLAELQQAYLDTEGDLEGGETPAQQGASALSRSSHMAFVTAHASPVRGRL